MSRRDDEQAAAMKALKDQVHAAKEEAQAAKEAANYERQSAKAEMQTAQTSKGQERAKQPDDFSML
jgi:hypothetical protein